MRFGLDTPQQHHERGNTPTGLYLLGLHPQKLRFFQIHSQHTQNDVHKALIYPPSIIMIINAASVHNADAAFRKHRTIFKGVRRACVETDTGTGGNGQKHDSQKRNICGNAAVVDVADPGFHVRASIHWPWFRQG